MKIFVTLLIPLVLLAVVALLSLRLKAKGGRQIGAYRQRKLMTDNEAEFFGRLVVAMPDHYIFPQVAMSGLIESSSGDRKTALADRLRIAQQRVDFVICSRTCDVVAVVELDDKSHDRSKDIVRDARLAQAGIRTVRFQARSKPRVEALRNSILSANGAAADSSEPSAVATSQAS